MTSTGTLGVDLAAQSRKTAGCMIEWDERGFGLVHCPADDYRDQDLFAKLIDTQYVTRAAIDAPFGWPTKFIETITAYQHDGFWPDPFDGNASVRSLRLRATDRAVHAHLGLTPLSVSTDRIGIVAMRCARLLAAVQGELGQPVDRSGQDRILEVYPAAALRSWEISPATSEDPGSYKGDSNAARIRREWVLEQIARHTSAWLRCTRRSTSSASTTTTASTRSSARSSAARQNAICSSRSTTPLASPHQRDGSVFPSPDRYRVLGPAPPNSTPARPADFCFAAQNRGRRTIGLRRTEHRSWRRGAPPAGDPGIVQTSK